MSDRKAYKKAYSQKYYEEHKEELKKRAHEWIKNHREQFNANELKYHIKKRRDLKIKILNHYGPVCACCGEAIIDFLTIDHINGDGSKDRKIFNNDPLRFYQWIVDNNYPDNLQILCMNCNWGRRLNGECPHKKCS